MSLSLLTGGWKRRVVVVAFLVAAVMVLTHFLDRGVYHALVMDKSEVEGQDWYRLLRVMGYLPTWILIGGAMLMIDGVGSRAGSGGGKARGRLGGRGVWGGRGLGLMISAASGGLLAELIKRVVGRERPGLHDGLHVFKPIFRGFVDDSNLGFVSSHTAVAFGALCFMGLVWPRGRWLFLLVAGGCGLSRMLVGAHFLGDVVGGAVAGMVCAYGVWKVLGYDRALNRSLRA